MNYVDDIRRDREDLARVLDKHAGIKAIVEDFYPDRAHFIYELLQNAEDAQATEATFILQHNRLIFEHNGRSFDEADVRAITDIGAGTKSGTEDKIGRFGVGFKAVFLYTESPRIWSPEVSFEITQLVLPSSIPSESGLGTITRFEFPFNNPKKPVKEAYCEVETGLNSLAATTLLFLTHLQLLSWQVDGQLRQDIRRIENGRNHVAIERRSGDALVTESHFLRFMRPAVGLEKQHVSIAFELESLSDETTTSRSQSLAKRFRIAPASPGTVAVFFPAEKEASGLRFHLHAPFVPELSRASIKDTPANEPLFDQIAALTAASLHTIRDLGLLTRDLLSVLPNPQDLVPECYTCIQTRVVDEMNHNPLTPTQAGGHAPATHLLQAKASLKDLLSDTDLVRLLGEDNGPLTWAVGAQQRNSSQDRFLNSLAIQSWDVDALVDKLSNGLDRNGWEAPDQTLLNWLAEKPDDWLQRFYAFLYRELEPDVGFDDLYECFLVRTTDGKYAVGSECFFSNEELDLADGIIQAAVGTYKSGKNRREQEAARNFLEAIGVSEIGESDEIEAVLNLRYSEDADIPDESTYQKDLLRFIEFAESNPSEAKWLFRDFYIFHTNDDDRATPSDFYLDSPFRDTGLKVYFEALGAEAAEASLADSYATLEISPEKVGDFAALVGARVRLEIADTSVRNNPDALYLWRVPGQRYTSPIDRDYLIPGLERLMETPSLALSRLLWNTMCALGPFSRYLVATYQKNEANGPRTAHSQLVHRLRNGSWVPQGKGTYVRPRDASSELLPPGFPFDQGDRWLELVEFGKTAREQTASRRERQELAKQLGFADEATLDAAKWFADLPLDERQRLRSNYEQQHVDELPEQASRNPEQRSRKVMDQAQMAPGRETEIRNRSVAIGYEAVKQEAEQYLRQQYTRNGVMICQACKHALPFKLDDGHYYVEKVEFVPGLEKRHYQNYIALCPNHAAMFQHANSSRNELRTQIVQAPTTGISVILAQVETRLHFTEMHLTDLQALLEAGAQ